jgi:hypothetical protein
MTAFARRKSMMSCSPSVSKLPGNAGHGTAWAIQARRQNVLDQAYAASPIRFQHKRPQAPESSPPPAADISPVPAEPTGLALAASAAADLDGSR